MSFLSHHKFIILIGVAVVAILVWWGLSGSSTPEPTLTATQPVSTGGGANQDIISTLLTLRAVKLDGSIFSETGFQTLKDFSTQIVPETVGRPNPFAPLSGGSEASGGGGANGAQIFTPRR